MAVPKTAVDEQGDLSAGENQVGRAGEFLDVEPESETEPVRRAPDKQLGLSPLSTDATHHLGATGRGNDINHYNHTLVCGKIYSASRKLKRLSEAVPRSHNQEELLRARPKTSGGLEIGQQGTGRSISIAPPYAGRVDRVPPARDTAPCFRREPSATALKEIEREKSCPKSFESR